MWLPALVLTTTALMATSGTCAEAGRHRSVRQASSSCSANSSCVLLSQCPELQRLLRPPTREGIRRLQSLTCGFQNSRALVCCPSTNPPTARPPTVRPPTARPPTGRPTTAPPVTVASNPTDPAPGPQQEGLLPRNCGHALGGDRIHGGTPAALGAYPWMAVLGFTRGNRQSTLFWGCGGTLINRRYVLTAAHCTVRAQTNFMDLTVIRLGEHNLSTDPDCDNTGCAPSPQDLAPESVVRHPNYNSRGVISDDVALIRLDRPVQIGRYIQPVCLPGSGDTLSSLVGTRKVVVTGWGDTETGRRSQTLLQVVLPHVPRQVCMTASNYSRTLVRGSGQLCFGGEENMDSCFKDSGGPAIILKTEEGPPFVQVGIVSYGPEQCGLRNVPGIYTDVIHYRNWIVNNLRP